MTSICECPKWTLSIFDLTYICECPKWTLSILNWILLLGLLIENTKLSQHPKWIHAWRLFEILQRLGDNWPIIWNWTSTITGNLTLNNSHIVMRIQGDLPFEVEFVNINYVQASSFFWLEMKAIVDGVICQGILQVWFVLCKRYIGFLGLWFLFTSDFWVLSI